MKCLFILLFAFLVTSSSAQISEPSTKKTFDKDGLKFNYPADWTVTDKSSEESQFVLLSKENTTVLISLLSPRAFIRSQKQFGEIQANAFKRYVSAISKSLSSSGKPEQEYLCLDFNGRKVAGTKFTGSYNNEPSTGEVYPFVLGDRFLALAYIRTDKDGGKTDVVWQELVKSLTLEGSNKNTASSSFGSGEIVSGGVLNSRALRLAQPFGYSKALRDAGAFGPVVVEVEIDETGKVVSARAVSGHKLLFPLSESAAKKSKFTPTMRCGTPIRVTGVIVYNFRLN